MGLLIHAGGMQAQFNGYRRKIHGSVQCSDVDDIADPSPVRHVWRKDPVHLVIGLGC
ncbi:Hypothetical protein RAK1035_2795 [Roseovarius sp. AK1035]|nr:Hypothetical protein RAK1035_2795 [Roseovarius sp. AK1035]